MQKILVLLTSLLGQAGAFWRLPCGRIQLGRLDPVVTPGGVAGHVHTISGPDNFDASSNYQSLTESCCTSCPVQSDRSAYWTPQLYYRYANGSFSEVGNGGTIVYYLDRGDNVPQMEPFPEGFKMISGDPSFRSYDASARTWSGKRALADRVSFNCINYRNPQPETNAINNTDCPQGLRAQIQFPTCWDGVNNYKTDQSHVAHLDRIDNGDCPPTHPKRLPHLFYEVYYDVANIKKEQGGYLAFAQGDPTGYGFHGDFLNGWNTSVLTDAIAQCMGPNPVNDQGSLEKCPPLAATLDSNIGWNCPEQPALVSEAVTGLLTQLPGCNAVIFGPNKAVPQTCQAQPVISSAQNGTCNRQSPSPGDRVGDFAYFGCAKADGNPLLGTKTANDQMTVDTCAISCRQSGYRFSGLGNGRQCSCGNYVMGDWQSTGRCSAPGVACAGDVGSFCGGQDFIYIYNDTKTTVAAKGVPEVNKTVLDIGSGVQATYSGCFTEVDGRALRGDSLFNNTGMTNEMCGQYCSRKGFHVFGTEYRQECYCGSAMSTQQAPEGDCSMVCRGDTTEFCGGASRLSVWSIAGPVQSAPVSSTALTTPSSDRATSSAVAAPTVVGGLYLGCVSEVAGRTLNADSSAVNSQTLELCAQRAVEKNYRYFGLEYSSECYLGDVPNPASASLPESKCKMPCSGNAQQLCGGSSAISLFNNTLYTPRIPSTIQLAQSGARFVYQGCFADKGSPRTLNAFSISQSSNSVDFCVQTCYSKGYTWAGVEYGSECYCNSAGTGTAAVKSDSECSKTCAGNMKQNCGGSMALQVYRLFGSS